MFTDYDKAPEPSENDNPIQEIDVDPVEVDVVVMFDGVRWWVKKTLDPSQVLPSAFRVQQRTVGWQLAELTGPAIMAGLTLTAPPNPEDATKGEYHLAGQGEWRPGLANTITGEVSPGRWERYNLNLLTAPDQGKEETSRQGVDDAPAVE